MPRDSVLSPPRRASDHRVAPRADTTAPRLSVVVDVGGSGQSWWPEIDRLHRELAASRRFSTVDLWQTDADASTRRPATTLVVARPSAEVSAPFEPTGYEVFFLVTDCGGRAWRDGRALQTLGRWRRHGTVVLVHLLPEPFWGDAWVEPRRGRRREAVEGDPWSWELEDEFGEWKTGAAVPILALDEPWEDGWVDLTRNDGAAASTCVLPLDLPSSAPGLPPHPPLHDAVDRRDADDRESPTDQVSRFRATASRQAVCLAGLLAAAPLTTPIMRQVRETHCPEASNAHLAEILLGGLVTRWSKTSFDSSSYAVDFLPGVRRALLAKIPADQAMDVLRSAAAFQNETSRSLTGLVAGLHTPTLLDTLINPTPEERLFARFAADVLDRFWRYRDVAEALGRVANRAEWDIFVSYIPADRGWADWICYELEQGGYRVLRQAYDSVPQEAWVAGVHAGIAQASIVLPIVSNRYLDEYNKQEWRRSWRPHANRDDRNRLAPFLVEKIEDSKRATNDFLISGSAGTLHECFSDATARDEQARQTLLQAVRDCYEKLLGRNRPIHPDRPLNWSQPQPRFPADLPDIWNVPLARNPDFVGREQILVELTQQLRLQHAVAVGAQADLAGVGLTQLAVEYAYRSIGRYSFVWWVPSSHEHSVTQALAELAGRLGPERVEDDRLGAKRAYEQLSSQSSWLLIFDDLGDVRNLPDLPTDHDRHILITSRTTTIGGGQISVLPVPALPRAEAVKLLQRRLPDIRIKDARNLAESLGHLPVGLELGAAFLRQRGQGIRELLRLLAADHRRATVPDLEGRLAVVVDQSMRWLRTNHRPAADLLAICSHFDSNVIPFSFLEDGAGELLAEWQLQEPTSEVAGRLVELSLARLLPDGLVIHHLVQAAVRRTLPDVERRQCMEGALRLLQVTTGPHVEDTPECWPGWDRLLPHVLAACRYGAAMPDVSPRLVTRMCERAAGYLASKEYFEEAGGQFRLALRINRETLGQQDPVVVGNLTRLAETEARLGHSAETERLVKAVLEICRNRGDADPQVARSLARLARSLHQLGNADIARELFERAFSIVEQSSDVSRQTTASVLVGLASTLTAPGQVAAAAALIQKATALQGSAVSVFLADLVRALRQLGHAGADGVLTSHLADVPVGLLPRANVDFMRDMAKVLQTVDVLNQSSGVA